MIAFPDILGQRAAYQIFGSCGQHDLFGCVLDPELLHENGVTCFFQEERNAKNARCRGKLTNAIAIPQFTGALMFNAQTLRFMLREELAENTGRLGFAVIVAGGENGKVHVGYELFTQGVHITGTNGGRHQVFHIRLT